MKKSILLSIVIICALLINNKVVAQADVVLNLCTQHLQSPYISDGQEYKTLLSGEDVAEFHTTFYGGTTYRIVGNTGTEEGNLIFTVYDKNRNVLFSNDDYNNSSYWDLKFNSTVDCIIEARLNNEKVTSGYVLMLIGFKQQ